MNAAARIFVAFVVFLAVPSLSWGGSSSNGLVYHGRILKPDGQALEESGLRFLISIYGRNFLQNKRCLLYQEEQNNVDMANSMGAFEVKIGEGNRLMPATLPGGLSRVFLNSQAYAQNNVTCDDSSTTFTADSLDRDREIEVQVFTSTGTINIPAQKIRSVPWSMQAMEIGGYSAEYLLKLDAPMTQQFPTVAMQFLKNSVQISGGVATGRLLNIANPVNATDVANKAYVDSIVAGSVAAGNGIALSGATVSTRIDGTTIEFDGSGIMRVRDGSISSAKLENGSVTFTKIAGGGCAAGTLMTYDGASWGCAPITVPNIDASKITSGILPVAHGGTNSSSFFANKVIVSNGTGTTLTGFSCNVGETMKFDASGVVGCYPDSGITVEADPNVQAWAKVAPGTSFDTTGNILNLTNTGVTSGTYSKVTVDSKGRVTSGGTLLAADIPSLSASYVAVGASAGGQLTGTYPSPSIAQLGATNGQVLKWNGTAWAPANDLDSVNTSTTFAGDVSGTYNTTSVDKIKGTAVTITSLANNHMLQYNGTAWVNRAIPTCSAGNYLTFNGTAWSCSPDTTGTSPGDATTSSKGIMQVGTGLNVASGVVSVAYGTTAGTAVQGNDSRLSDSRAPTGSAGGDLTGTYPNPTLAQKSATTGQVLKWNGTAWAPAADTDTNTTYTAGDGLALTAGDLSVNVDNSTIEINADTLRVKDSGITSAKIADGTIVDADISATANVTATKIATGVVDNTEFNYLNGVTSSIQTQLGAKVANAGNIPSMQAGTLATRPAFGTAGRLYVTTDTNVVYRDTGTAWVLVGDGNNTYTFNSPLSESAGAVSLGTVPIAKGGTGTTSFGANQVIVSNGTGAALAGLTCTSGEVIKFDASGFAGCGTDSGLTSESDPQVGANTTNYLSKWNGSALVTSGVFDNGTNVGIGTATPSQKLDVNGNINATQLCIAGSCKSAWDAASVGAMTANYLAKWDGSLFVNGSVVDDGTKVYSANYFHGASTGANGKAFQIGNDASIQDIGVANTAGLYGETTPTEGGLKLGSGGGTLYGKSGNIGVANINPGYPLDVTGNIRSSGEIISTNANQIRMISGNYGAIWRNDGNNLYLLQTASGDQYGTWNSLRPFSVDMASGNLNLGSGALIVTHGGNVSAPAAPTVGGHLTNKTYVDAQDATKVGGSGTANYIPKFTASGTIGNSTITDNGTTASFANKIGLGSTATNYNAAGGDWNFTMTLNGLDTTSIGFHDSAATVGSIKFSATGFVIGGDSGWGNHRLYTPGGITTNDITDNSGNFHIDATGGNATYINWFGGTGGVNIGNGASGHGNLVANTITGNTSVTGGESYSNGWFRSNTSGTGWYHQVHGGGWYMNDNTWIRNYGNKSLWMAGAGTIMAVEGSLGVGTSAPGYKADIAGPIRATAYYFSSDQRLKKNIESIHGLEMILKMRGVRFDWIKTGEGDIGLIAQEVEKVAPDLVSTDPQGFKSVKYGNIVAPLIEATKTLYGNYQVLQEDIENYADKLSSVDRRVASLEEKLAEKDAQLQKQQSEIDLMKKQIEFMMKKLDKKE